MAPLPRRPPAASAPPPFPFWIQVSETVLEWALENVYKEGDEIHLFTVRRRVLGACVASGHPLARLSAPRVRANGVCLGRWALPASPPCLQVIPSPQPQVVGGFGAMDSIVTGVRSQLQAAACANGMVCNRPASHI